MTSFEFIFVFFALLWWGWHIYWFVEFENGNSRRAVFVYTLVVIAAICFALKWEK